MNKKEEKENKQRQSRLKYEKKNVFLAQRYNKDKEYPSLLLKAKKAGFNEKEVSKYIKYMAINGEIIIKKANISEMEIAKKHLFQMRKMGNNINQLTRLANANKTEGLSKEVLLELQSIKELIRKIELILK